MQPNNKAKGIIIEDVNLGGIADSLYEGPKNSVGFMVGWDIHSIPGLMQVNQQYTQISPTNGINVINDIISKILICSDGLAYAFGATTGNIWKIDNTYAVTLLGNTSPAAGSPGILDAREYFGYIYYAMQNRLGRVAVGAPTNWATKNDNYQTFQNGDAGYHPMKDVNLVLYIGDGNVVAQMDSSTGTDIFSAQALQIPKPQRVSALGKYATNLLVGTTVNSVISRSGIYLWDTYSVSFLGPGEINEVGINAFLPAGDLVIVNAGYNGNFYQFDPNYYTMTLLRQVPGVYTNTQKGYVYLNAVENFQGLPLFGMSNILGNPTPQGIWSLGGKNARFPQVINCEVPISTGHTSNVIVSAMAVSGQDVFVAWKDNNSGTYGIDKKDYSNKFTGAYIDTKVIKQTRTLQDNYKIFVNHLIMPSNCSFDIRYAQNYGTFTEPDSGKIIFDAKKNQTRMEMTIPAKTLQYRVLATVSGNTAPTIEDIVIPLV